MMKKKISAEDAKLFQDNMSDVAPIKHKSRVEMLQQTKPDKRITESPRLSKQHVTPLVLTEPLQPLAYIQEIVSGVSPKQIRAIKQGKKVPEKIIDLHHHTQVEALQVLDALVANYHDQERFILIVHGTNAQSWAGSTKKPCLSIF